MANTYLTKTFASAGTRTKYTISVWVKRSKVGATQCIFSAGTGANNSMTITFNSNDTLYWNSYSNNGSNYDYFLDTTRKFTDPSAWYHIVCAFDSTQSTASNRMKIYINGVQETQFLTETYPGSYSDYAFNNILHEIGQDVGAGSRFFDGSMSHFYGIDGTAYAASTFGSTDSTTGEWKINTSPSVTMGTNGFLILKDGNTITDQSSNSNNFTLGGGTLTKTQDCPSNVFAIWNTAFMPFNIGNQVATNGGTTIGSNSNGDSSNLASMGARSGKYYWEIRVQNAENTRSCGIVRSDIQGQSSTSAIYPGGNGNASNFTSAYNMRFGYVQTVTSGTQAQQASLATLTTGDFLGVALDIDNLNIKWYKNGSLVTTTNLTSAWIENGLFLIPANRMDGAQVVEYNFGNGCFGSTQLTGTTYPGTGGLGIFKYAPPTGFTALSTKGLNL